ncbi:hypothetical protein EYF80_008132 [Liparis tanakae]|uniref:Uncharacterized protein n=1 Tax=Liparis tanakae TaxID=230148 RepID=A0A4Z2IUZ7_9TELE|nr:hypothetical protein EYF80_008132 [Liparis tanakae]
MEEASAMTVVLKGQLPEEEEEEEEEEEDGLETRDAAGCDSRCSAVKQEGQRALPIGSFEDCD